MSVKYQVANDEELALLMRLVAAREGLEIWPETPILPKPLFSWRRLPM